MKRCCILFTSIHTPTGLSSRCVSCLLVDFRTERGNKWLKWFCGGCLLCASIFLEIGNFLGRAY